MTTFDLTFYFNCFENCLNQGVGTINVLLNFYQHLPYVMVDG